MNTAQDQQSRAELSDFEAWYAKQCMRSDDAKQGLIRAWAHLAWKAARALPADDDALLPIAAKSHGAWDGLEELLALPDGTEVYTAAQVQAMGRVPPSILQWPTLPPRGQSSTIFDDGYDEGWAKCLSEVKAMLAAAPRPPAVQEVVTGPCGQCKDSRVPCQCALDTILRERGLIAVSRESFQHMVNKIAVTRTPACWCATCDSAASPFGIPTRMSLCQKCGDKRCPRAQHHDSDCFASPKETAS